MPYQKLNGAASTVASYSTGLLTVATGTGGRFGAPTVDDPLLLQTGVLEGNRATGYLVCTGRSGDVLTVTLTPGGVVNPGDSVAAGEAAELWTEVYGVIATKQAAITLTTTGAGGPATFIDDVLNIPEYDAGGGGITSLTGDVLASGTGSVAATLATVNSNVGTWNTVTVNAKGLVTGGSNASYVTTSSLTSALSGYVTTSALTSTLADYATVASLSSYVTTSSLTSTLGSYATTSALSSHTSNTSNPHSVTKSQVGLGSVDNTSDLAKPISTLTQTALDGKQASLPTGQSSAKFLGGDFAFHDLPARKDLICLGQWTSSGSAPLAAGDMAPQASLYPADCDVLYVAVIAKTNGAGGGFTFNLSVNGTPLFSSAQTYAASTTTLAVISSGFAVSSITGGASIMATIATAGSDVLSVTIALHGRPA